MQRCIIASYSVCCLSLTLVLAACTPVAAPSVEQTPARIGTEEIVALTKIPIMTGEVETETAFSPKNNATAKAILATKFAGGTQEAETMTALPTPTLAPVIPSNSPYCHSTDLKTDFQSQGATGNIILMTGFTNISGTPCYMQAWPQVILADGQGKVLDVYYGYPDFGLSDISATATQEARESEEAKVGLWPGWRAGMALIWYDSRTWCGAPFSGNLVVRLTLMDDLGTVDIPTDFRPGGACDSPGARTGVSVHGVELMPSSR